MNMASVDQSRGRKVVEQSRVTCSIQIDHPLYLSMIYDNLFLNQNSLSSSWQRSSFHSNNYFALVRLIIEDKAVYNYIISLI